MASNVLVKNFTRMSSSNFEVLELQRIASFNPVFVVWGASHPQTRKGAIILDELNILFIRPLCHTAKSKDKSTPYEQNRGRCTSVACISPSWVERHLHPRTSVHGGPCAWIPFMPHLAPLHAPACISRQHAHASCAQEMLHSSERIFSNTKWSQGYLFSMIVHKCRKLQIFLMFFIKRSYKVGMNTLTCTVIISYTLIIPPAFLLVWSICLLLNSHIPCSMIMHHDSVEEKYGPLWGIMKYSTINLFGI
jgi:hypothetical protein